MLRSLRLGGCVQVWSHEAQLWQDGVVCEINEASGEFLVDYFDADEEQAWTSIGQAWRTAPEPGPAAQQQEEAREEDRLQPSGWEDLSSPALPLPAAVDEVASASIGVASAPPDSDAPERAMLYDELAAGLASLHEETLATDGFGAETTAATVERFAALHARSCAMLSQQRTAVTQ